MKKKKMVIIFCFIFIISIFYVKFVNKNTLSDGISLLNIGDESSIKKPSLLSSAFSDYWVRNATFTPNYTQYYEAGENTSWNGYWLNFTDVGDFKDWYYAGDTPYFFEDIGSYFRVAFYGSMEEGVEKTISKRVPNLYDGLSTNNVTKYNLTLRYWLGINDNAVGYAYLSMYFVFTDTSKLTILTDYINGTNESSYHWTYTSYSGNFPSGKTIDRIEVNITRQAYESGGPIWNDFYLNDEDYYTRNLGKIFLNNKTPDGYYSSIEIDLNSTIFLLNYSFNFNVYNVTQNVSLEFSFKNVSGSYTNFTKYPLDTINVIAKYMKFRVNLSKDVLDYSRPPTFGSSFLIIFLQEKGNYTRWYNFTQMGDFQDWYVTGPYYWFYNGPGYDYMSFRQTIRDPGSIKTYFYRNLSFLTEPAYKINYILKFNIEMRILSSASGVSTINIDLLFNDSSTYNIYSKTISGSAVSYSTYIICSGELPYYTNKYLSGIRINSTISLTSGGNEFYDAENLFFLWDEYYGVSYDTYPSIPPNFSYVNQIPTNGGVEQNDKVNVTAGIETIYPSLAIVYLNYTNDSWASYHIVSMNLSSISGITENYTYIYDYVGTIPEQPFLTTVKYWIFAAHFNDTYYFNATSSEYTYTVEEVIPIINWVEQNPNRTHTGYVNAVNVTTNFHTIVPIVSVVLNYTINGWENFNILSMIYLSVINYNYTYYGLIPPQPYETFVQYRIEVYIFDGVDIRTTNSSEYNYTTKDFSNPIIIHFNNSISTINGIAPQYCPFPDTINLYFYANIIDVAISLSNITFNMNYNGTWLRHLTVTNLSNIFKYTFSNFRDVTGNISLSHNGYLYYYWNATDDFNHTTIGNYTIRLDTCPPILSNIYTVPTMPIPNVGTWMYCNASDVNGISQIYLKYSINSWGTNYTIVMSNVGGTGYRAFIPAQYYGIVVDYLIYVSDGFNGWTSAGVVFSPNINTTYGQYILEDPFLPKISFPVMYPNPYTTGVGPDEFLFFFVSVIDEESGVSDVQLIWRNLLGIEQSVTMVKNGGMYSATIPPQWFEGDIIIIEIVARDNYGNVAMLGPIPYQVVFVGTVWNYEALIAWLVIVGSLGILTIVTWFKPLSEILDPKVPGKERKISGRMGLSFASLGAIVFFVIVSLVQGYLPITVNLTRFVQYAERDPITWIVLGVLIGGGGIGISYFIYKQIKTERKVGIRI